MQGKGSRNRFQVDHDSFGNYMERKRLKLHAQNDLHANQDAPKIFKDCRVYINTGVKDALTLKKNICRHGGMCEYSFSHGRCTHILAEQMPRAKVVDYLSRRHWARTPVLHPSWVHDSIAQGKLLDWVDYVLPELRDIGQTRMSTFVDKGKAPERTDVQQEAVSAADDDQRGRVCDADEEEVSVPDPSEVSAAQPLKRGYEPKKLVKDFHANSRLHFIGTWRDRVQEFMKELPPQTFDGFVPLDQCSEKFILHIDMDCFFASVSTRNRPDLQGKPVAVCHGRAQTHGTEIAYGSTSEISAANYVARQKGVRASMFLGRALELCPDIATVPFEFEAYQSVGREVLAILYEFSPRVQVMSCDESYVVVAREDMKTFLRPFFPSEKAAQSGASALVGLANSIRSRIFEKTQCTASIGIGPSMLTARLATAKAKPNGVFEIPTVSAAKQFIEAEMALRDLPGVGWRSGKKLSAVGFETCAQVLREFRKGCEAVGRSAVQTTIDRRGARGAMDEKEVVVDGHPLFLSLAEVVGRSAATRIIEFCHGIDTRSVTPTFPQPLSTEKSTGTAGNVRTSIGAEVNYGIRIKTDGEVYAVLDGLCAKVAEKLEAESLQCRTVTIRFMMREKDAPIEPMKFMGHGPCDVMSRSSSLAGGVYECTALKGIVRSLYHELFAMKANYKDVNLTIPDIRGVGVHVARMEPLARFQRKIMGMFRDDKPPPSTAKSHTAMISDTDSSSTAFPTTNITHSTSNTSTNNTSITEDFIPNFSQVDQSVLEALPASERLRIQSYYRFRERQRVAVGKGASGTQSLLSTKPPGVQRSASGPNAVVKRRSNTMDIRSWSTKPVKEGKARGERENVSEGRVEREGSTTEGAGGVLEVPEYIDEDVFDALPSQMQAEIVSAIIKRQDSTTSPSIQRTPVPSVPHTLEFGGPCSTIDAIRTRDPSIRAVMRSCVRELVASCPSVEQLLPGLELILKREVEKDLYGDDDLMAVMAYIKRVVPGKFRGDVRSMRCYDRWIVAVNCELARLLRERKALRKA